MSKRIYILAAFYIIVATFFNGGLAQKVEAADQNSDNTVCVNTKSNGWNGFNNNGTDSPNFLSIHRRDGSLAREIPLGPHGNGTIDCVGINPIVKDDEYYFNLRLGGTDDWGVDWYFVRYGSTKIVDDNSTDWCLGNTGSCSGYETGRVARNDKCFDASRTAPACTAPPPPPPSGGTCSGHVILYQDANYGGACLGLGSDDSNLVNNSCSACTNGDWNDDPSSIKLDSGYKAKLFEHTDYNGASVEFTSNTSYLGDQYNDWASSVKVIATQSQPPPPPPETCPGGQIMCSDGCKVPNSGPCQNGGSMDQCTGYCTAPDECPFSQVGPPPCHCPAGQSMDSSGICQQTSGCSNGQVMCSDGCRVPQTGPCQYGGTMDQCGNGCNPPPAGTAPSIKTQPADQNVAPGDTATFTVEATGSEPLRYQWKKNGADISGANSPSYTTPATAKSDSGSLFKVIVSNDVGSATSREAKLTVSPLFQKYNNPSICSTIEECLNTATFWLYVFSVPILSFMILYGGFLIMTSGGQEERYGKGIKSIKWGAIGFIIVLLSAAIAAIVRSVLS